MEIWDHDERTIIGVPIPEGTTTYPSGDKHLCILDLDTSYEYGFWKAEYNASEPQVDKRWRAAAGHVTSVYTGNGIVPYETEMDVIGANAANFPLLGGLVHPEDFMRPPLNEDPLAPLGHACVFAAPHIARQVEEVWPSPRPSDPGVPGNPHPYGLRVGDLLQLDPLITVSELQGLGLRDWEIRFARTCQQYGMYCRDGSGAPLLIYFEDDRNRALMNEMDPDRRLVAWEDFISPGQGAYYGNTRLWNNFPWDRFRFLAWRPPHD